MKEIIIIKIGGSLIGKDLSNLTKDIKELYESYNFIIVHGGGPQIDKLYKNLGKQPKIYQTPKGYKTRYSDKEAIDIIKMALAGYANKTLVELFQKESINAFGFCAADGRTVVGKRKSQIQVLTQNGKRIILHDEYSGKDFTADLKIVNFLLENNYMPIIGSLAISYEGDLINSDGDRIANTIALPLNCKRIISLTDVNGIFKDKEFKSLIKEIKFEEYENYMKYLDGGMKKKVLAAIESLELGINEVIIGSGLIERPVYSLINKLSGSCIHK